MRGFCVFVEDSKYSTSGVGGTLTEFQRSFGFSEEAKPCVLIIFPAPEQNTPVQLKERFTWLTDSSEIQPMVSRLQGRSSMVERHSDSSSLLGSQEAERDARSQGQKSTFSGRTPLTYPSNQALLSNRRLLRGI